jgi:hypothetical protein
MYIYIISMCVYPLDFVEAETPPIHPSIQPYEQHNNPTGNSLAKNVGKPISPFVLSPNPIECGGNLFERWKIPLYI